MSSNVIVHIINVPYLFQGMLSYLINTFPISKVNLINSLNLLACLTVETHIIVNEITYVGIMLLNSLY